MFTTLVAAGETDPDPLTTMWQPSKSFDLYALVGLVLADTTLVEAGETDPDPLTAMWQPSKSFDLYCPFIVVWTRPRKDKVRVGSTVLSHRQGFQT